MSGRTVPCTTAIVPKACLDPPRQTRWLPASRMKSSLPPDAGQVQADRALAAILRAGGDPLDPSVLLTFQAPAAFVHHPVMYAAEQRQVGQRRGAAPGPPDQVMPVAPSERPAAALEDAGPVP